MRFAEPITFSSSTVPAQAFQLPVGASGSALCACAAEHDKSAAHAAAGNIFIAQFLPPFGRSYHGAAALPLLLTVNCKLGRRGWADVSVSVHTGDLFSCHGLD